MNNANGILPATWQFVTLGEVLERIEAGTSFKAQDRPAVNGEIGVLKLSAVTWNKFRPCENKALLPDCDPGTCPHVRKGDLLISRANTTELIAAVVMVEEDHPNLLLSDKTLRLVPKKNVAYSPYLLHALRTPFVRDHFERHATGTSGSMRNISQANIAAARIALPPLAEQRRIAAILDKADAIYLRREEGIRLTEELLRSTFLKMFGDPVKNERGWPMVKVEEAGDVQLGRQRAPKYQTGKHTHPYLRVANVFEDQIDLDDVLSMDFNESDFVTYRLRGGDILLNEGQSTELVGRPAMWRDELPECCFQNTLIRFRACRRKAEPEFALEVFLYYLHTGQFARISSKTSNVAHLGAGRFTEMAFPLPPLDLQQRYSEKRRQVYALLAKRRTQADEARHLFNSLGQWTFRGEL